MRALRLGTRGSALALVQSGDVATVIRSLTGATVELVTVTTHGDTSTGSLASMGGTGVFATALREALIEDRCDFVVHSLKDLPTAPFPGLTLAATPVRGDARDALCARDGLTLAELPPDAVVGTGSPRRVAQVLRGRPDVTVTDIRGNVDTRLGKVRSGDLDAVVLAAAGLRRLGLLGSVTEFFDLDAWPTAAGQGVLALETRDGQESAWIREALALVEDADARLAATTERAALAGLEAGCSAPVGIRAIATDEGIDVLGIVYDADGATTVRATCNQPWTEASREETARAAAQDLVEALLAGGAADLVSGGGNEP